MQMDHDRWYGQFLRTLESMGLKRVKGEPSTYADWRRQQLEHDMARAGNDD